MGVVVDCVVRMESIGQMLFWLVCLLRSIAPQFSTISNFCMWVHPYCCETVCHSLTFYLFLQETFSSLLHMHSTSVQLTCNRCPKVFNGNPAKSQWRTHQCALRPHSLHWCYSTWLVAKISTLSSTTSYGPTYACCILWSLGWLLWRSSIHFLVGKFWFKGLCDG